MKTYYTDYTRHCMRFYARYPSPEFRSEIDKRNWKACERALGGFSQKERELLISVYANKVGMDDGIQNASEKYHLTTGIVWALINNLENKIARRRELI